jgi:hypothetical protein
MKKTAFAQWLRSQSTRTFNARFGSQVLQTWIQETVDTKATVTGLVSIVNGQVANNPTWMAQFENAVTKRSRASITAVQALVLLG